MKPIAFGLVLVFVWLAPSLLAKEGSVPVQVSVCDLVRDRMAYDGKLVKIRAAVLVSFERTELKSETCTVWVALRSLDPDAPGVELKPNKNTDWYCYWALLEARMDVCPNCPRFLVTATLVGQLDAAAPGERGFGHLSQNLIRLVVQSVSDVKAMELRLAPVPPYSGDDSLPPEAGESDREGIITVEGRIVLYDWAAHDAWYEDLVIRVVDEGRVSRRYLRVVYSPFDFEEIYEQDLSFAPVDRRLPATAFVGRGDVWRFTLRIPRGPAEQETCKTIFPDHNIEDEMGKGKIPRHVPTPGARAEDIPPIESLPCYVLERGGLQRVETTAHDRSGQ